MNLAAIEADKILQEMLLIKQSRLSVMLLSDKQFNRVLELAGTAI